MENKHTHDLYIVTNPGQIHLRDRNDNNKTFITIEDWHNSPETIAKLELIVEAVNSFQNLKWKCSIWEPKINELSEEVDALRKNATSLQSEIDRLKEEKSELIKVIKKAVRDIQGKDKGPEVGLDVIKNYLEELLTRIK